METNQDRLFIKFNEYFEMLDKAPLSPNSVFQTETQRGLYESNLTFSFRKYQAAMYHLSRVKQLLEYDRLMAHKMGPSVLSDRFMENGEDLTATSFSYLEEPRYGHELVAFLAAIKTGLDFVATASSIHFRGISCDSIRTLMKLVIKKKTAPIIDEISARFSWLEELRNYRHHLLHRMVLRTFSGSHVSMKGGKVCHAIYPVIVPKSTPKRLMDTRKRRIEEQIIDIPNGLSFKQTHAIIQYPDGKVKTLEHEIQIEASEGYERIECFMEHHLNMYIIFLTYAIDGFKRAGFEAKISL